MQPQYTIWGSRIGVLHKVHFIKITIVISVISLIKLTRSADKAS